MNVGKTDIKPLPQVASSDWIVDLNNVLPKRGQVSANGALNYLEFAVLLADKMPDGSVLRYAFTALMNAVSYGTSSSRKAVVGIVLRYAIYLSFHRPILIPLLDRLFNESVTLEGKFVYADEVRTLIDEHVRLGHSDALAWMLYFANKYGIEMDDECSRSIVQLEDCVPLLMLYLTSLQRDRDRVIQFAKNLDANDLYGLDRYWLLLYQLFVDGAIGNPYGPGTSFDIMKAGGVSFVVSPTMTRTFFQQPPARGLRSGGRLPRRPSRRMRKSV